MPPDAKPDLDAELRRFRLSSFRPGQREVISAILAGRDCLCVMPTGGGKSLCYQLPGNVLPGLTLVVSPLIALMKDQVDQLQVLGLPVTFINSTLPLAEQYARLDAIAAGRYRMAYVVPERFRSERFLDAVWAAGLKLLAVDEAHCISEWGHDFRPDYARLGKFRRMLGRPTTIALTATATDAVRRDIIEQLDLDEPQTFITGFARPNLHYEVLSPRSERQKMKLLLDSLRQAPGPGIIYTATRKRAEEVAQRVAEELRRRTAFYHAGMLPQERHKAQDDFMKNRAEIVVATNAFGMGIDKPDVRFVVHYNIPGTLEAYYQEAGRAGRDGHPSRCLLLYSATDRKIQEYFIESAYPDREYVARVYELLCAQETDPIEMTQQDIKEALELPIAAEGVGACEQILESAGVLERLVAAKNMASVRLDSDLPTLADLLPKQATSRRRVLRAVERLVGPRRHEMVHFYLRALLSETEMDHDSLTHALRELNQLNGFTYVPPFRGRAIRMIRRDLDFGDLKIDFVALGRRKQAEYEKLQRVEHFALSGLCRQEEILRYFGDEDPRPCGHCDNCDQRRPAPVRQAAAQPVARMASTQPLPRTAASPSAAPVTPGLLKAVRIVLSGVARTQSRFRCGKNLIAQMLCGSMSARMDRLGLNRLSTFGLLKELTQPEVVALIDALIDAGYIEQVDLEANRPVLELTESGTAVMKGKAEITAGLPLAHYLLVKLGGAPPGQASRHEEPPRVPPAQEERDSEGGRPTRPPVPGFGRGAGGEGTTQSKQEVEDGRPPRTGEPPDHYWTWRLLAAGFRADECAIVRNVAPSVILEHAIRALEDGWPVRCQSCLEAELIASLEKVEWPSGPVDFPHILPRLPAGTTVQEVRLFLKCLAQGPAS